MWHGKLSDTLYELGFTPSKADGDIWMRPTKDGAKYEYIAVYVDDLAMALENPEQLIGILMDPKKYNFKLKGTGPLSYHLGADYSRDKDGTLVQSPKKYIDKMMAQYQAMFGELPKTYVSPLEQNDHPEMDTSKPCDPEQITQYQSMIGSLQWLISLGKFDIYTAVMTMSRFRVDPKEGHIARLKRIYGYVRFSKDCGIRYRTEEPDYSSLPPQIFLGHVQYMETLES
jgi:hypothetical protein